MPQLGLIHVPTPANVPHAAALPMMASRAPPPHIDWHRACPADGDALGNNDISDCVEVAMFRAAQMRMANAWGSSWKPSLAQVEALYTHLTGWDPANPASDVGTMTDAAMLDWARNGIKCLSQVEDVVHWLSVHPQDIGLARLAIAVLGPVQLSFGLPLGLRSQPPGAPWVIPPQQTPGEWDLGTWGYHRVLCGGYDIPSDTWTVRTWGYDVVMSTAFMRAYCVATDATLARTWFSGGTALSPAGTSWDIALAEFRSVMVA